MIAEILFISALKGLQAINCNFSNPPVIGHYAVVNDKTYTCADMGLIYKTDDPKCIFGRGPFPGPCFEQLKAKLDLKNWHPKAPSVKPPIRK